MDNISSETHCKRAKNSHGNGDDEERRRKAEIICKKL